MNVPELAVALRAERDRHHDELTRIITEFTGTTDTPDAPDGLIEVGADGRLTRRTLGIIRSTPQENNRP